MAANWQSIYYGTVLLVLLVVVINHVGHVESVG